MGKGYLGPHGAVGEQALWGWGSQDALCLPTHLSSQVVAGGQVLEAVEAVPVASSSTARVVVDHLGEAGRNAWEEHCRPGGLWEGVKNSAVCNMQKEKKKRQTYWETLRKCEFPWSSLPT